jgi:hypothetical protein
MYWQKKTQEMIVILTIEFNSTYGFFCLWQTCHVKMVNVHILQVGQAEQPKFCYMTVEEMDLM